jgi:hypothetical protein
MRSFGVANKRMRNGLTAMNFLGGAAATLICVFAVSGCSNSVDHSAYVSRPVPNSHVLMVPELRGGWAGWNLARTYRTMTEAGAGGAQLTRTSTGPIFAEGGCDEGESGIRVYALTTRKVAAVSVAGDAPIATTTNSTLPEGLRVAAVEVVRHNGQPSMRLHCPRMTPFDADGKPISREGKPGRPQAFRLPGTRRWEVPARLPRGACELTVARLPRETVVYQGDVATQIRPYRGLLGRALLSCADTIYIYHDEHHLTSAVLLNASHPGATLPPLPAMKPLAGHPGIFGAPGSGSEVVARRIPGACMVVVTGSPSSEPGDLGPE